MKKTEFKRIIKQVQKYCKDKTCTCYYNGHEINAIQYDHIAKEDLYCAVDLAFAPNEYISVNDVEYLNKKEFIDRFEVFKKLKIKVN